MVSSPAAVREHQHVVELGGERYHLASSEQAQEITRRIRAWTSERVPAQQVDVTIPFEIDMQSFHNGYGFSYADVPFVYETANKWDAAAPGKLRTWPRLTTGESFTTSDFRGWQGFFENYLYVMRGGYVAKYQPSDTGDEWPIIEVRYLGENDVVAGRPAAFEGALYIPVIDETDLTLQRFQAITTVSTTIASVQEFTTTGSPTGGTWTLTFDDGVTSTEITGLEYDISAASLQTQLRTIPGLERVTVALTTGAPNRVWEVTLTAASAVLASTVPDVLAVNSAGLTGGTTPAITAAATTAGVGDQWDLGPANEEAVAFAVWQETLVRGDGNLVSRTAASPFTEGNWSAEYEVGDSGRKITDLVVYDTDLIVGKEDGPWAFNESAVARPLIPDLLSVVSPSNCIGMHVHGDVLYIPHRAGLQRWRPGSYGAVGPQQDGFLEGDLANGWGTYMGFAPYGGRLYAAVNDWRNDKGAVTSFRPGNRAGGLTPHMSHLLDSQIEHCIIAGETSQPATPVAPDTITDDNAVGTITWSDPENAGADDGAYATAAAGTSHYLKALLPAATRVPTSATVKGVTARVKRRKQPTSANTGATSPGTLASAAYGANAWSDAANAASSDDSYATVATDGVSEYLKCTNLGLSVPTTATILGVKVEVERKRTSGTPAMAFRSKAQATPGAGTGVSISKPSGVVAGDLMVAAIMFTAGSINVAVTAPSGWTLIRRSNVGDEIDGVTELYTYQRRATTSESSSWAWSFAQTVQAAGAILAYSGVSSAAPVAANDPNAGGTGTTATFDSITTAEDNSDVLAIVATSNNRTFAEPSGYTERVDANQAGIGNGAIGVSEKTYASAGATGAVTATWTGSSQWATVHLALTPSQASVDDAVYLLDGDGAVQGDNKAATGTAWPSSDAYAEYGGAADVWGATLTPAVVNDSDWGAVVAAYVTGGETVSIDHVRITVYYEDADVVDNVVRLVVGGSVTGDNKADTSTQWPESAATKEYGGSADLWGASISPAQANAADFGLVLSVTGTTNGQAEVDYITLTIYYSLNGAPASSSFLVVLAIDAARTTVTPQVYRLPAAGMDAANDPGVDAAVSDASLKTGRFYAPERNVTKVYERLDLWLEADPQTNTPGVEIDALIDGGSAVQFEDGAGSAATLRTTGAHTVYMPAGASAVGSYCQIDFRVPALSGDEEAAAYTIRDARLHGAYMARSKRRVRAVLVLRQGKGAEDGTVIRTTPEAQKAALEALYGQQSAPIAFKDPETGVAGYLHITGLSMREHQFKGAQKPEWVAEVEAVELLYA